MRTNMTILALVMVGMAGCAHARSGDEKPGADLGEFIDPTIPVSPGSICVGDPCAPTDSTDMSQMVAVDMAQLVMADMAMALVDMNQAVDMTEVQDLAEPVDMAETPDMADDCEPNNGHGHGWGNIKHGHCVPEKGKQAD